ncbi:MAG: class I SAM-dependent methyltransferase [Deltaproteobacteria bacterium]|nr:class I SAM-dependent methyltransferase [Deltaproteobacteria bacterium]
MRSYDAAARWYDGLAKLYSLSAISRAKALQTNWLQGGQRMLAVGVGSGEEVPALLERGLVLTCLEPAEGMRRRLRARVGESAHQEFSLCSESLLEHHTEKTYDVISANFFLNLYDGPELEKAVRQLRHLLRPGGCLLVADFAPYRGHGLNSWLRRLYYRLPQVFFSALGLAQWHPLFDYRQLFDAWGFRLEEEVFVPVVKGVPVGFVSLCFRAVPENARQGDGPR